MPKGCDFQIMLHQNKKEKMIGFVLNHNMAPFVGKTKEQQRIDFVNSEIPNTFIVVEWTISLSNVKKEDHASLNSSLGSRGTEILNKSVSKLQELNLTGEEIRAAIDEKEKLKTDIKSLKVNMDIVL